MTPAVFLVILWLGVTLAAPTPDYNLDAEWEKWKRSNEKTYSPVCLMDTKRESLLRILISVGGSWI